MTTRGRQPYIDDRNGQRGRSARGEHERAGFVRERAERCSWCDRPVGRDEGFRVGETSGPQRAVFCRLEHVVPWRIRGPHWDPGELEEPSGVTAEVDACSHCGDPLTDVRVLLVRHRGEHRISDAFCSTDHLADWAKAGGRWR